MDKIEYIILSSGEEAVTLDNNIIIKGDPGRGDQMSQIKNVAKNLEKATGNFYTEIKMEPPIGREQWDQVIALRKAAQSVDVDTARKVIEARGIEVDESDKGYYFFFNDEKTGLPFLASGAASTDFDEEDEAVMAAYMWLLNVDANAPATPAEEETDAPRP